jgi:hypothetical protein
MAFSGPIFLCGTSRSGTTLLKGALDKSPRILISPETHYFDDLRVSLGPSKWSAPLSPAEERRVQDYFLALSHRPFGHQGNPDVTFQNSQARLRTLILFQKAYNYLDYNDNNLNKASQSLKHPESQQRFMCREDFHN